MKYAMVTVIGLAAACSRTEPPVPVAGAARSAASVARTRVITAVGPSPRGFAELDAKQLRAQAAPPPPSAEAETMVFVPGGASPAACGVALERIDGLRVAIGEPLRIAAEIDGAIDRKGLACILGSEAMAWLSAAGATVRDRTGGVAIDYARSAIAGTTRAARSAADLLSRCVGSSCVALELGPPAREVRIEVQLGEKCVARIHGAGFHSAAALAAAFATPQKDPALSPVSVRDDAGALVIELAPSGPDVVAQMVSAALAVRSGIVEPFRFSSVSMAPTFLPGDRQWIAKGTWDGPPKPGDLIAYRRRDEAIFLGRLIARGGQTVTESEQGLAIDGVAVRREIVDPAYQLDDVDSTGRARKVHGTVFREHLNGHDYRVLHTEPVRPGRWTVPNGELFFLGDNRQNANDSRYDGGMIPEANVVGRVLGVWYAPRNGVPDWNLMGTAPE